MCLKKVWKLHEVLNVRVTAGHGPAQAQEMRAGRDALPFFLSGQQNLFCNIKQEYKTYRVLAGCFVMRCEKVMILDTYKKIPGKVSLQYNKSQTKVWELSTLLSRHTYKTTITVK